MKSLRTSLIAATALLTINCGAASYRITSPSGAIAAEIINDGTLAWTVSHDGREVLSKSPISMTLTDGTVWGAGAKVSKVEKNSVSNTIATPFSQCSSMADHYNGITLKMKGGWSVEFRAYDDGVAYRFVSSRRKPFGITSEQVEFNFPDDFTVTVPYVRSGSDEDMQSQFFNSFENRYTVTPLSGLNPRRLAFLPLAVDAGDGLTLVITETDLRDYPGLYLYNPDGAMSLKGKQAPYPAKTEDGGYNNIQSVVIETAPYIADVNATRTFPWRVIAMGKDAEIASTNLSYLLAEPSRISDTSWIKPGKVAWDWWNSWNLTGVDFEAGINTATYKHYIDFAADNGIEYVILDDGWAAGKGEDLFIINPDIDLEEIISYAKGKDVGIIL